MSWKKAGNHVKKRSVREKSGEDDSGDDGKHTHSSFVSMMFRFARAPVEAANAAMIEKRISLGDRRCVTRSEWGWGECMKLSRGEEMGREEAGRSARLQRISS